MFPEMRRAEKALDEEQTKRILAEGEYGVLSLAGGNGYPYGVPLNYVYENGAVYFHGAQDGYKLYCLEQDCRVSFCVTAAAKVLPETFSTQYRSVILFGRAETVEGDEKRAALRALIRKYSPDHAAEGERNIERAAGKTRVVKIIPAHITGKANN